MIHLPRTAPCTHPRRSRGIYLIELLAVIVVLGAVLVVTAQIVTATTRASTQARRRDDTITRLDLIISALRRDIWNADAFKITVGPSATLPALTPSPARPTNALPTLPPATRMEIAFADGRTVFWQTSPEGVVSRSSPSGIVQTWRELPPITFTSAGPVVTMNVDRDPWPRIMAQREIRQENNRPIDTLPPEQLTFISQRLLAKGAK